MPKNLQISELALVVVANNYDPSLMNPGFLTYSGIVPSEWELSRQPVISSRGSQLIYNNGVNIVAYPNRFMSVESLTGKEEPAAETPEIILKYIETLRNIDYQALGINFRSYITCNEYSVDSNQYISDSFLVKGEWLQRGSAPVKAGMTLMYEFEENSLHLTINEATLKLPENQEVPIVLFTGNFNYQFSAEDSAGRIDKLKQILNNWQQDLANYTSVVELFLKEENNSPSIKELAVAV